MDDNITIVTAFFDIGRGDWTPDKGLPHYLHRTNKTYIERFLRLCRLRNDIIVITSKAIMPELIWLTQNIKTNITFMEFDLSVFSDRREQIQKIQKSQEFQSNIDPRQRKNPEYWDPDYVLVTDLKPYFVDYAIKNNQINTDLIAWIDFGYCRSDSNIPKSKEWKYEFNKEKIHLFNYKEYDNKPIQKIMFENDVYILGAKAVATKENWSILSDTFRECQNLMMSMNVVDDDQGFWLMAAIKLSNIVELHLIPDHHIHGDKCFVLFNEFNNTV